jgi:hypothetical protein
LCDDLFVLPKTLNAFERAVGEEQLYGFESHFQEPSDAFLSAV